MTDATQRPVVLVPGACLGGWAWRSVAARLRSVGHEVYPATLTGLGERVHLADADVDLDTHIADVVNLLDYEDLNDVVLVGHSYSGIVVTGVADRRPERIAAVVYLDTSPVPDGTAIADLQTPEQRERQRHEVMTRGEGWLWPVPDRESLSSGVWGSAYGLTPADLELIEARATAQPYATFTSPLKLIGDAEHDVRKVAIFCSKEGISLATVRELIARRDPRAAAFSGDEWELHELPTGHWAMFSLPEGLAELLHGIAGPGRTANTSG